MRIVMLPLLILCGVPTLSPAGDVDRQVAKRGFFYPGYQQLEHPFEKPGKQHWVATDGDDAGPGTKAAPWKTLGHAAKTIKGGDVVNILPGLYLFNGGFGPAGPNEDKKTLYRASDPSFRSGRVVISADKTFASPNWSLSDNLSIQGLWIGGSFANAHKKGGGSYSSRNSEIVGCTFFNAAGFAGGPAYDWLFQDNRMVHQGKGTHGPLDTICGRDTVTTRTTCCTDLSTLGQR